MESIFYLPPSFAASEITFRYAVFEESLSVKDLRAYAETHLASSQLKHLLSFLGSKIKKLYKRFFKLSFPLIL
jgi:hypothetical protein